MSGIWLDILSLTSSAPAGAARRLMKMKTQFRQFVRDESGATAIEYGLIASLIALVIIGAVSAIGNKLTGTFNEVTSNLH